MSSTFRNLARSIAAGPRRWMRGLSCAITGHQHSALVYFWSSRKKSGRDGAFNATGVKKFQLLTSAEWCRLSEEVDRQMQARGALRESRVDWAENKRVYIDCEQEPIKSLLAQIRTSERFTRAISEICGTAEWDVDATQIWRNHPEKVTAAGREINSTYYHVDNGGPAGDRLLFNVFMYLTEVKPENGPFTYYDSQQTRKIHRRFLRDVFRNGNLRRFDLVPEIEQFIPPQQLTLEPGEAVAIDNQLCLHRAGYCSAGHRDMMEMLIRPRA